MVQHDPATVAFFKKIAEIEDPQKEKNFDLRPAAIMSKTLMLAKENPARVAVALAGRSLGKNIFGEQKTFTQEKLSSRITPYTVYALLNEKYERDWFDWEPETIWKSLNFDVGEEIPDEYRNMIMALQLIVNTNQAHEHWHVFEKVANAFNGNVVDFGVLQPIELDEAAKALRIIARIRPKQEFEPEISGYIASVARSSGVVFLPKELFPSQAQVALDNLNNDLKLKAKVEATWPNMPKKEDPLNLKVQIIRLKEIQSYA